ncbi:MAG: DUF4330 family protein [Caldisericia bacterium]|nr:DUF4330 family protein [Caldisericia bacterium]MDD4614332.1 DUF4330 family protein [Caldisericia bacterium]
MTIIDEKGKLFGWINIIDLLVIILLVVLLFMSVRFFTQRRISVEEKDSYIVKVRATNLGPEIADTIQKGLPIQMPDGTNFGMVITDPEVGPTQVYVTTPQGMLVPRAQPKMMDATFSFLCFVPKGSPEIKYGSQSFKAGATGFIESNLTKYTIHVLSIQSIPLEEAKKLQQTPQEESVSEPTETQKSTSSNQTGDTAP